MDQQRWTLVNSDQKLLTKEEINQGWHFCPDWDYLLIGPGMLETDSCYCQQVKHNEQQGEK